LLSLKLWNLNRVKLFFFGLSSLGTAICIQFSCNNVLVVRVSIISYCFFNPSDMTLYKTRLLFMFQWTGLSYEGRIWGVWSKHLPYKSRFQGDVLKQHGISWSWMQLLDKQLNGYPVILIPQFHLLVFLPTRIRGVAGVSVKYI